MQYTFSLLPKRWITSKSFIRNVKLHYTWLLASCERWNVWKQKEAFHKSYYCYQNQLDWSRSFTSGNWCTLSASLQRDEVMHLTSYVKVSVVYQFELYIQNHLKQQQLVSNVQLWSKLLLPCCGKWIYFKVSNVITIIKRSNETFMLARRLLSSASSEKLNMQYDNK